MDGSAQSNPGPTASGMIIKKQGRNSTLIKIAMAVKYNSYEGELESIKIATEYARDNISTSNDTLLTVSQQYQLLLLQREKTIIIPL